jgi:cation diffusion facilitator CzcD-associated flavoprotein CzcO
MEPKSAYPVVVIGAGLGGLCSGAYLSRFGFPSPWWSSIPYPEGTHLF